MKTSVWNKGFTKETNISVRQISRTMKEKHIDNFAQWREEMRKAGRMKSTYPPFQENGDLAELIGVVLGDGHVGKFPRTEILRIVSNSNNSGFIKRYGAMVKKIFGKEPRIAKRKQSNAVDITVYEKNISTRLGIQTGARLHRNIQVPRWILRNEEYIVRYLRGLYEAEGSYNEHKPTYTYKFLFSNKNPSMLGNVYRLLKRLGFHPHITTYCIQISKKEEATKARKLLRFREY